MPLSTYRGSMGVFSPDQIGGKQMLDHYDAHGWCVIRGMYDVKTELNPIHAYVNHLIDLKLAELGLPAIGGNSAAIRTEDYLRVCAADRSKGGDIYRACRNLLPLHRLATSEKTSRLAAALM